MKYDEVQSLINRTIEERADILDTVFMPFVFSLSYTPCYSSELKVGEFKMDHGRGTVTARPDEDSLIVFYRNQSDSNDSLWDNDNEIHVYLDSGKMVVDLPRFGAVSRQSEIKFNGNDKDREMYENMLPLVDYRKRQEVYKNNNGIRYMDYLQFCDDVSAALQNKEHLRMIQQIINDALSSENGDDDLIDFLIVKIKKRFDPLNNTESDVRELIREDFQRRVKEHDGFVIIPHQEQLEIKERKKQRVEGTTQSNVFAGGKSVSDIFQSSAKEAGYTPKEQESKRPAPVNKPTKDEAPTKRKLTKPTKDNNKGGVTNGERADLSTGEKYGNTSNSFF